jgi:hypothetical protein
VSDAFLKTLRADANSKGWSIERGCCCVPEPSTLIIWSLLGSLGISIGWWRRRKAA